MIELPKLQDSIPITEEGGMPSLAFQRWWQEMARLLEGQLNTINAQLAILIDAVKKSDKLTASSILPANALSATDAGANATITVANHARLYGDGTSIPVVTGGTVTGLAYSTYYGVYYDDPSLLSTTPTYHVTTTPSNALNNFVVGRHYVGSVTTPAAAGAPVTGGASPPGTDPADRHQYSNL